MALITSGLRFGSRRQEADNVERALADSNQPLSQDDDSDAEDEELAQVLLASTLPEPAPHTAAAVVAAPELSAVVASPGRGKLSGRGQQAGRRSPEGQRPASPPFSLDVAAEMQ